MTESVSSINITIRRKEMKCWPFVGFQTFEKTSWDVLFGRTSEYYHEHRQRDNIYTHEDTSSSSNTSHSPVRRIPMTGVIKATKIDQHNHRRAFVCGDNKVFLFFQTTASGKYENYSAQYHRKACNRRAAPVCKCHVFPRPTLVDLMPESAFGTTRGRHFFHVTDIIIFVMFLFDFWIFFLWCFFLRHLRRYITARPSFYYPTFSRWSGRSQRFIFAHFFLTHHITSPQH